MIFQRASELAITDNQCQDIAKILFIYGCGIEQDIHTLEFGQFANKTDNKVEFSLDPKTGKRSSTIGRKDPENCFIEPVHDEAYAFRCNFVKALCVFSDLFRDGDDSEGMLGAFTRDRPPCVVFTHAHEIRPMGGCNIGQARSMGCISRYP